MRARFILILAVILSFGSMYAIAEDYMIIHTEEGETMVDLAEVDSITFEQMMEEQENWLVSMGGDSSSGIIEYDDAYSLGSNDFTIEIIFKINSWPDGWDVRLIGRAISNQEYVSMQILADGGHYPSFGGRGGGVEWQVRARDNEIELDTWYQFVGVRDGNQFTTYLNGEEVSTGEYEVGDVDNEDPQPWAVGCYHWSTDGHVSYFTDGSFDEARIWSVARSSEEIENSTFTEVSGDAEGLIGYWKFNEGEGDTFFDSSPTRNDGTLDGDYEWIEADWEREDE